LRGLTIVPSRARRIVVVTIVAIVLGRWFVHRWDSLLSNDDNISISVYF
jgi:hypothetical protein